MSVIASEWHKLHRVRSSRALLGAMFLVLVGSTGIGHLMVRTWDGMSAADRIHTEAADIGIPVMPFAEFLFGVLAALVVTAEYTSGAIRTTLVAVPRRGRLLASKLVVVLGVAVVGGQAVAWLTVLATDVLTAGRPAPIRPWETVADAVTLTVGRGVGVAFIALVGFGLGWLLRATAGALVTMTGLLFVAPMLAFFLPADWARPVSATLPTNLAGQLVGAAGPQAVYSPVAAGAVMAAWLLLVVGGGWLAFRYRDA
ncbi:ABC-2 family transporter [Stackebrandtia albiflava]|uniref:ABC-2 family transporter n=1 Tax=Stackebrandtia albiflava TaxID=406432 RepID=A0A562V0M2_9ACTN|nr:ABC transporter permease [Stackebrandtia albiflava]TWJ11441.1 ABC-2 family transporter [Stackebrandtia albiflava]